jgi:hypothetical protein
LAHITKMLRRRIKTGIDEFDKHVIWKTINEFDTTESECPSLQSF